MAAGGTYSGTVTVPVQKGTAFAVSFDGLFIPALLTTPEDGYQNERDYRHKSEVRDVGGNIVNKTFGGPFQRARGTLTIPSAQMATIVALLPHGTLSMQQIKTDGTLEVAENWMIEEDPEIMFNRENNTVTLAIVKEPGITPA